MIFDNDRFKELLFKIERQIDWKYFWGSYFALNTPSGDSYQVKCCFHDDKVASLGINIKNGLWNCLACGAKGNAYQFLEKYKDVHFNDAVVELARVAGIKLDDYKKEEVNFVAHSIINKWHDLLMSTPTMLTYAENTFGWNIDTLKRFKIGYDNDKRFTIPIKDESGSYVNVRRYADKSDRKMMSYKVGYGKARLYPYENLKNEAILLTEGEKDCILANQLGYKAVTVTAGALTWKASWNKLFKDKKVFICYDADKPGKQGAVNVANNIVDYAKVVRIVEIPLSEPKGADFTDFIHSNGMGRKDFNELLKTAKIYASKQQDIPEQKNIDDLDFEKLHLAAASQAKYYNKDVELQVMVSGKDLKPYILPKVVKFTCDMQHPKAEQICPTCSIGRNDGKFKHEFHYDDEDILEILKVNKSIVKGFIKRKAGVPKNCYLSEFTIEKAQNIEEIKIIPEIDFSSKEAKYVTRDAYFLGYGIEANKSYILRGRTIPDPKSQYATHLIFEADETSNSIDSFEITPEIIKQLKIFQTDNIGSTKDFKSGKIAEIYEDLENNVTKIYERRDLLFGIDLTYHSVLHFEFQDTIVTKGWVECLIVGDTRTGKTETISSIINHYKAGEIIMGENLSFAGLIGGLTQHNNGHWLISWGKIPLNDRRLLVIDEVSGMPIEDISRMSGARSSGVAHISKIASERTNARTRLIWISNPRKPIGLMGYSFGIQAIKGLIVYPEDIARFDFAVTAGAQDCSPEVVNRLVTKKIEHIYTNEICMNLVKWAWSRRPDDVQITPEATEMIIKYAIKFGKEYHSSIPLIEPSEIRIKLAKLSVACACRFFSTDDVYQRVIVKPIHVKAVCDYLQMIYSKDSMGYDFYSDMKFKEENLDNLEMIEEVIKDLDIVKMLLSIDKLQMSDLEDVFGSDKAYVKSCRRLLIKNNALKATGSSFCQKTAPFIKYLRIRLKSGD